MSWIFGGDNRAGKKVSILTSCVYRRLIDLTSVDPLLLDCQILQPRGHDFAPPLARDIKHHFVTP